MVESHKGIIELPGCDLEYQIEGNGPNALIVGNRLYYSRTFSENLRKHLRLTFADMRAFAPPPRSEIPLNFTLDLLLDDIEHIRQKLELGKIIIIGHSGNAFLALEYAKKYQGNVSHIVMIGTGPDFSDNSRAASDRYWEDIASEDRKLAFHKSIELHPNQEILKIALNQRFIWNYVRHAARIWYDYNFDSTLLWEGVHVNMPIFEYIWGTLFKEIDITKGLSDLNIPVFLALGRYDFIVAPPDSWDALRGKFKNLSIAIFENSGHSPFYEEKELFDTSLLKWLSSKKECT